MSGELRDRWVPLAEIARPHGVRGEVRLQLYNAESDFLLDVDEVLVRLKDGKEHEVSVDAARRADKTILLKLHSVDDRDRADEIRGAVICVRRSEFPPLDEGEFYACDVENAEVRVAKRSEASDSRDGRLQYTRIGVVTRFLEYPAATVLLVKKDGDGEIEVPLTDAYVEKVDADAGVVFLSSLEDL